MNATGARLSKQDVRDYKLRATAGSPPAFAYLDNYKALFDKNQGSTGSCTAHAFTFAAELFDINTTDQYDILNPYSVYGVRNTINGERWTGPGMDCRDALQTIRTQGIVPQEKWKGAGEVPEIITARSSLPKDVVEAGKPFGFDSYYKISTKDEIKVAISAGIPVILVLKGFADVEYRPQTGYATLGSDPGWHAILCVGYDTTGVYLKNSWGKEYPVSLFTWGNVMSNFGEGWGVIDSAVGADLEVIKPYNKINWLALLLNFLNALLGRNKK